MGNKMGVLATVILFLSWSAGVMAATPRTIGYQGYLKNSSGQPVNGPLSLTFSLYSAASGPDTALWTETHSGVTVTNGVYSVVLGNGSPTPNPITISFDSQYYLGISVGTDPEMTPRQPLTVSPYAFRAVTAESAATAADAATLGGQPASAFATSGHSHSSLDSLTLTGNLTLPSTNAEVMSGAETLLHTYGTENTFVGIRAGNRSMTGTYNTATGYAALSSNTTGTLNTAYGRAALNKNTEGHHNTAMGMQALAYNTTGSYNTATGLSALWKNTTGDSNSSFGTEAMFENTEGSENTAMGMSALRNNIASWGNVAVGSGALVSHGSNPALAASWGSYNTAVGYNALFDNNPTDTTGGKYNTALGLCAGARCYPVTLYGNISGANNTFLGALSGPASTTQLTNATAIGYKAKVNQSNSLVLGGIGADAVKVGIGTQTPAYALDVAGDIRSTSGKFMGDGSSLYGVHADTATMLAADPTDCPAGSFAYAIAANGSLTCSTDGGSLSNVNASKLGNQTATDFAAAIHTHTGGQITSPVSNATNADFLDGYHAGNSAGNVAVNNGVLNSSLNADLLDGQHATAFAAASHLHDATNISSGTLASGRISGAYTGITGVGTLTSLTVSGNTTIGGTLSFSTPKTGYYNVSAPAFSPVRSATTYDSTWMGGNDRYMTGPAGVQYLNASVSLPHGAALQSVSCRVADSSATYNVSTGLVDTINNTWICSPASSTGSSGVQTLTSSCLGSVINNVNSSYYVRFSSDTACGSSCAIYSCTIAYTVSGLP